MEYKRLVGTEELYLKLKVQLEDNYIIYRNINNNSPKYVIDGPGQHYRLTKCTKAEKLHLLLDDIIIVNDNKNNYPAFFLSELSNENIMISKEKSDRNTYSNLSIINKDNYTIN